MWLLKKYGLPWLYWNVLLHGRKPAFLGHTLTFVPELPPEELAAN